jgi:hypothetical protein
MGNFIQLSLNYTLNLKIFIHVLMIPRWISKLVSFTVAITGNCNTALSAGRGSGEWSKTDDRRWGSRGSGSYICSSCIP